MDINILREDNSFDKLTSNYDNLLFVLKTLKDNPEFSCDRLNTIIAIDLGERKYEIIYDLYSTLQKNNLRVSLFIEGENPHAPSVINIFKSAYFDECEIFDMFGIIFDGNKKLKRLFLPKTWNGYPLRKDYLQNDVRLEWNKN